MDSGNFGSEKLARVLCLSLKQLLTEGRKKWEQDRWFDSSSQHSLQQTELFPLSYIEDSDTTLQVSASALMKEAKCVKNANIIIIIK